ncbi:hypothetical protein [Pseudomonas sp. CFBP 8772]|uniref:hypothetical protein n=1 Tax=Pseudomonas sp. CFBP 8772 TaxID=2775284 RepID=UPI001784F99D|nr:hypothetical protein [Pseudomonas sp. CFBP 8772]MBD8597514.1 hypothetical protein [Pseudomonas sp. CFBP 8772]
MKAVTGSVRPSALFFLLLTVIGGCSKDYTMAPSPEGEKVTITINAPQELAPEVLRVMYRSAKCQRVTHDAHGQPQMLDGNNSYEGRFERSGETGMYHTELFVNGGGACEWRLSNVVFSVVYRTPERFGEGVVSGAGAEVIVVFDHNSPQLRVSAPMAVTGSELNVVKDFYPWIKESYIRGYIKRVDLSGGGGGDYTYYARQARTVYFEPILHSDFVVSSVAPKKHIVGDFIKFKYPDGTVESDGRSEPNFEKMQKIRAESGNKRVKSPAAPPPVLRNLP